MPWYEILFVLAFVIGTLNWFGIKPHQLAHLFLERKSPMLYYGYITIASTLTLFFMCMILYFPLVLDIFDEKSLILDGAIIYFLLSIWMPFLSRQKFWRGRVITTVMYISIALAIAILIGFWIVYWPNKWLLPLILTCLLIITLLVAYMLDRRLRKATKSNF